ncbi:MAG: hypothetical protein IT462_12325 [Planctomycetes bacterium]|nr:hypothetical protein [Planctomycetota bacterium]
MFSTLDISTSGLRAERIRLNLIANNIANANSTRDAFGNRHAYQRKLAVFEATGAGVDVPEIVESDEAPRLAYEPGHPDALRFTDFFKLDAAGNPTRERRNEYAALDEQAFNRLVDSRIGYVEYPNVDPVREMADAMLASRAYEANAAVMNVTKTMIAQSLRIIA